MTILDPITQLEDAIIAWLSTDTTLAQYHWQRWESDVTLEQPRGYVNVSVIGEWDLAIQGAVLCEAEVVLESVPKTGSQAPIVAIVLGMLGGREIIDRLNNQITDGSMKIVGPPEGARAEQAIEREIRVRRIKVTFPAIWNVVYV
jgi:hypothetical protein